MRHSASICLTTILALSCASPSRGPLKMESPSSPVCSTPREFITALGFIREDDSFKLPEPEARALALQISEGCDGAASRFIRVSRLLLSADAGRRNATEWGLKFARADDAKTEAFISAFKRTWPEDRLDLDLATSLKISEKVSLEFSGDQKRVRKDFEALTDFCSNRAAGFILPPVQCAQFAADLAQKGESFEAGIAKDFKEAYEFLNDPAGPALTAADAFQLSHRLVEAGPGASKNFKQAYRFASSDRGLTLGREEAIRFAEKLASKKKASSALKTAEPESAREPAPFRLKSEAN